MANAFSNTIINNLHSNIRTLYHRRKQVGKLVLTNEEYIQTFVPHEARELFRDITPLMAFDKFFYRWDLPRYDNSALNATLHIDSHAPVPVPRELRMQPDAPKEIVERIYQWTEHGGDVSRDFGRVGRVLSILNENFSRTAIRYYWPTILALCSENPQTKDLVQELQEMRQPVKLNPLPLGLPLACRQTAETIATARLIPADIDETTLPHELAGRVTIGIVEGQHYIEPFGAFYGA